ncbi:hypothetical protein [Nocardia harenae]|uniref:hypothetical protein n=1 Tax=Nocardia harenae TaxID=358707 RepID=UPI0008363C95|nr:hypothetical protein [Nocardia harenae]
MRSKVDVLRTAVDDGELWIDGVLVADGAPERCAQRYEQLADRVEEQIAALAAAGTLPGFGALASGAALRAGFEGKAGSAVTALREYAAAARELASTLRAAGAAYAAADATAAERLAVHHA